jgi:hypothetical protein
MHSSRGGSPRALAAPFVLTVSSVALGMTALACRETPPPNQPNPGAATAASASTSTAPPSPITTTVAPPFSGRRLVSPTRSGNSKPIFVDGKSHCWVEGIHLGDKAPVDCPSEIDVAAWANACSDKLVFETAPDHCQCEVFGNPPYVGTVPCPKR